jgi:hypothetical protein
VREEHNKFFCKGKTFQSAADQNNRAVLSLADQFNLTMPPAPLGGLSAGQLEGHRQAVEVCLQMDFRAEPLRASSCGLSFGAMRIILSRSANARPMSASLPFFDRESEIGTDMNPHESRRHRKLV